MSVAAFKLQQRRRDQERILHETESFLHQHNNTERLLDWENRTQQQIQQREESNLAQQFQKQDEDELNKRQNELQSLYNREMSEWKDTLQRSLEVSQEEKIEQIRKRAYELKARRESERQKFVKECYERRWREACDDLRALDSKATLDRLMKDRKAMIQKKTLGNSDDGPSRQSQADDYQTNQRMTLMQQRENDESMLRRKSNLQTKEALDQQLQWKRAQIVSITAQIKQEEQEQLRHLALLEQQAKESQHALTEQAKQEGDDMLRETMQRAKQREDQRQIEKDRDWRLLQHALELERAQIKAENAKKEEGKEAASEYVYCLREQIKQEEKENQHVTAMRDEASEKIFQRNDEKMAAEAERRRQSMEEVKLSRQEQIRMKERESEELRREKEREFQETKAALQRDGEAERRKLEQTKTEKIENTSANKKIMEQMKKERALEQQEKLLLNKQIQYAEKIYQQKMAEHRRLRWIGGAEGNSVDTVQLVNLQNL